MNSGASHMMIGSTIVFVDCNPRHLLHLEHNRHIEHTWTAKRVMLSVHGRPHVPLLTCKHSIKAWLNWFLLALAPSQMHSVTKDLVCADMDFSRLHACSLMLSKASVVSLRAWVRFRA